MMAQDKADLTHSRLKQEADRCKLDLLTERELLQGSINRFKKNIRNFHWLEENGLTVQKLALEMGESHDKLCTELNQLVDEWSRYIRLTVISKEPQPQSPADREILKQEIDDQMRQINEYKEMVDQLKFENLDVFAKIENSSKMCQEKHSPIREDKLKPEFRPPPLTVNTTFLETKTFLRGFSTYIKTGEQSSGDLVFEVASNNVDSFWMKMFEGWGFSEETNLQEFIFMVNSIAKKRFSINTRRTELFCLKQSKNEDPIEFLNQIQELVTNSDWYGISENEAISLFFHKGVRCNKSRITCSEFMKKYPEGDIQKLTDQLKGVLTSEKPRSKENCTNCGRPGHSDFNCWGDCPACGEQGHSPGTCQLSPEKIRAKEKRK